MKRLLMTKRLDYMAQAEKDLAREVEVVHAPSFDEDTLVGMVPDVHAIVAITGVKVTRRVIDAAPLLEAITTPAVGFDGVDLEAATRAGVPVISNVGVSPESVAEFSLGLMIALSRHIVRSDRDVRRTRDWSGRPPYFDAKRLLGRELTGRTLGVVGIGQIGAALVRMARAAFSMKALAFDPFVTAEQAAQRGAEKVDSLQDLASRVDVLSLHMPLTKDTRHMVGRDVLRAMQPHALLINCSRGPVVDEAELVAALRDGAIGGAALDVYETEPISSDNPLLDIDNVILTPHLAGVSDLSNERRAAELVVRTLAVLRGDRPPGVANPEAWPRFLERRAALPS